VIKTPADRYFGFRVFSSPKTLETFVGEVQENSPASRSSLKTGLKILSINGTEIHGLSHEKVVQLIGQSGDRLVLKTLPRKIVSF